MASTIMNVDVPCYQPHSPAQLLRQPIKYMPNDQRTQQVLLGFSFEFVVTEDGQVVQYPEPLNNDEASV